MVMLGASAAAASEGDTESATDSIKVNINEVYYEACVRRKMISMAKDTDNNIDVLVENSPISSIQQDCRQKFNPD